MAYTAIHRHARISARKVRPLADLIRGKSVDEALAILQYQPQRGARMLEKLIKSALGNAEDITSRLKPIMDDIRIFSDKIARDPRQLGLKGALDRRPVGTGNKSAPLSPGSHEGQIIIDGHAYDPVVIE